MSGSSSTRMKTSSDIGERISSTGKEDLAELGDSRSLAVLTFSVPFPIFRLLLLSDYCLNFSKRDPVRLEIQLDWSLGLVFRNLGPVATGKWFGFGEKSIDFLSLSQNLVRNLKPRNCHFSSKFSRMIPNNPLHIWSFLWKKLLPHSKLCLL